MSAQDSSVPQMSKGTLILACFVLAFTNFMVVLDTTIANVSVAHIAGGLGISSSEGTWVITSYAVAEAICVPLTGWLARRFGTVRVFAVRHGRLRRLLDAVRHGLEPRARWSPSASARACAAGR